MSLKEAAAVADVSPKVIRHCLHDKVVKPARKKGHWCFSERDALFFALRDAIPFDIDRRDQKALYKVIIEGFEAERRAGWKRVNETTLELCRMMDEEAKSRAREPGLRVVLDFGAILKGLTHRLEVLAKRNERIASDPNILGGTPVFAGTRISVSHVGQLMLRGVSMKEMKEDFPRLKDDDFELARLVAMIGPKPGRPRRRLRLERAAS